MVALIAKRLPPSESRGVRVRVSFADNRGGARVYGWNHVDEWIANANGAVAEFLADHPIMHGWQVKGGAYLAGDKRVYLVDAG